MSKRKSDGLTEYEIKLLDYITNTTRENGVPPTIDSMIKNVEGLTSKSSVSLHLKKMVNGGYLVQKNVKGYYYPTSLLIEEVAIPKCLVREIIEILSKDCSNSDLLKRIEKFYKE